MSSCGGAVSIAVGGEAPGYLSLTVSSCTSWWSLSPALAFLTPYLRKFCFILAAALLMAASLPQMLSSSVSRSVVRSGEERANCCLPACPASIPSALALVDLCFASGLTMSELERLLLSAAPLPQLLESNFVLAPRESEEVSLTSTGSSEAAPVLLWSVSAGLE